MSRSIRSRINHSAVSGGTHTKLRIIPFEPKDILRNKTKKNVLYPLLYQRSGYFMDFSYSVGRDTKNSFPK